jgi:hypothetical protein
MMEKMAREAYYFLKVVSAFNTTRPSRYYPTSFAISSYLKILLFAIRIDEEQCFSSQFCTCRPVRRWRHTGPSI